MAKVFDKTSNTWIDDGKGGPKGSAMAPPPKTEEQKDREDFEKELGRKAGIADQGKFAEWRRKRRTPGLSSLAPK